MPSRTRRSWYSAQDLEVPVTCRLAPHAAPTHSEPVVPLTAEGHNTSIEWIDSVTGGSNHQWKNVQHWSSTADMDNNTGCPAYFQWRCSYPHLYRGTVQHPVWPYRFETFGEVCHPFNGAPRFVDWATSPSEVLPPVKLVDMQGAALRHLLPMMKSELSLVNSIFELKDFKSLPRSIKATAKQLQGVFSYRSLNIGAERDCLRDIVELVRKAGPDWYLQWSFNLRPLVADVVGIYRALQRTEKRINAFISRAGRPQTRHYTLNWQEYEALLIETKVQTPHRGFNPYGIFGNYQFDRLIQTDPSTFHVEVEYNYNYTQYQREHAYVLALLDNFGVNLNPSIIWNAIRYTFIVDWVLNVSSWLDQFKVSNMEPQLNIRRCLWSVKRRRTCLIRRRMAKTSEAYVDTSGSSRLPHVTENAYRRSTFTPSRSSIIASGLNIKEFSLGAALIVSQRRRRRR